LIGGSRLGQLNGWVPTWVDPAEIDPRDQGPRLGQLNGIKKCTVPDAATKRLKTLGTLAVQASSSLAKRQASAGVMREVAAQLQAD